MFVLSATSIDTRQFFKYGLYLLEREKKIFLLNIARSNLKNDEKLKLYKIMFRIEFELK